MTDRSVGKLPAVAACLAVLASGCYAMLSTRDVVERGTRRYSTATREEATEACAAALATLGYPVTVKQPHTGLVKTGPRVIMRTAYGGMYVAREVEDSLAWTVTVTAADGGAVLVATPRGYRNQTEVVGDKVWAEQVIGPKFRDLWKEIDANLGAASHASR